VRAFVEDELLTDSGFRENMAMERARRLLILRGAPASALDDLVQRRLLHVEERREVQRIELTHDVLTVASQNSCANLPPYVCANVRSLTPEFQPVLPSNRPTARRNAHAACANGRDFARRSAAPVTPLP
jgi:hypothetical protein